MAKKIMTIVGARPQFVKAGPVSRVIDTTPDLEEVLVHTGQHYDDVMSAVFFQEMNLKAPKYNLGLHGGTITELTAKMLIGLSELCELEKPEAILVYGDTTSTLAGALVAAQKNIPLIHVEAGLRSYNTLMPEEINRTLTDQIASLLCAPTHQATQNLRNEQHEKRGAVIKNTGDVMYDAFLQYKAKALSASQSRILRSLTKPLVLATIHRPVNTDNPNNLKSIISGLEMLSEKGFEIVMPIHPRTKKELRLHQIDTKRLHLIDPVGPYEMIQLLHEAVLVITDSGGLQKEAYFANKPCVVIRTETEWTELVEMGAVKLCSHESKVILSTCLKTLNENYDIGNTRLNIYGKGRASESIVNAILNSIS